MKTLTVLKKGEVYTVICPRVGCKTLVVTCAQCEHFDLYDNKKISCKWGE